VTARALPAFVVTDKLLFMGSCKNLVPRDRTAVRDDRAPALWME